jgi:hypothetical protein
MIHAGAGYEPKFKQLALTSGRQMGADVPDYKFRLVPSFTEVGLTQRLDTDEQALNEARAMMLRVVRSAIARGDTTVPSIEVYNEAGRLVGTIAPDAAASA